jgi:VCBS repeat-containing protein
MNIAQTFDVNQTVFPNPQSLVTGHFETDTIQASATNGTIHDASLRIQPANQGTVAGIERGVNTVDLQTNRTEST